MRNLGEPTTSSTLRSTRQPRAAVSTWARPQTRTTQLAILAVQKVAHRLPPSFICFIQRLALVGIHSMLSRGRGFLGCAALGATIGKTGLIRLELELLFADAADFDRESHLRSMILRAYAIEKHFASTERTLVPDPSLSFLSHQIVRRIFSAPTR